MDFNFNDGQKVMRDLPGSFRCRNAAVVLNGSEGQMNPYRGSEEGVSAFLERRKPFFKNRQQR